MTIKETKQYLYGVKHRLRNIRKRIGNLLEEYHRVEQSLLPKGIVYDGDRVQTSPIDPMQEAEIRKEEIRTEMKKLEGERFRHTIVTQRQINKLKSEDEKKILSKFFIDDISIEDAAAELSWSERQAYYLKKRGIENLTRLM